MPPDDPDVLIRKVKQDELVLEPDEIQKLPPLLDGIQFLLDSLRGRVTFVMTGSSARKLGRTSTNLHGGRAWPYTLFPLTIRELGRDFDLGSVCDSGRSRP
jgi:predicted AAA+ superfamily ATPase